MSSDNISRIICMFLFCAMVFGMGSCNKYTTDKNFEIKLKAIEALKSNVELKLNSGDLKEFLK